MSKGSKRRPSAVSETEVAERWARIFAPKKKPCRWCDGTGIDYGCECDECQERESWSEGFECYWCKGTGVEAT